MRSPQTKSAQIQIRVTPAEKRDLVRRARESGQDLSSWMLGRLITPQGAAFGKLVRALASARDQSYVLAEVGHLLSETARADLEALVESVPAVRLDAVAANQLAAMVETATTKHGIRPPRWTEEIEPLRAPWFPTSLLSVRLHLLCNAPPAFRRRNLFVDSTFEDRV